MSDPPTTPVHSRVSVIIPTWNGLDLLVHALESLGRQTLPDFETIVVDNGSDDGTTECLVSEFPDVRCVRLPENRGFAAAVNEGIRVAAGDVIVLMNNDTDADPDWLRELVGVLDRHPDVAASASRMLDYHDRTRIDSVGIQWGLFASNIGHGELYGPEYSRPRDVFGACAGAAAYRRAVLDEIGMFDESFFAYFEDVDLSARIQLSGYRCIYVPTAVIYHRGSATSSRMSDVRFYLMMRNSITVFLRYAPIRRLTWTPLVLAWPFARAVLDGMPLALAGKAVRDALAGVRSAMATRRRWARMRRVDDRVFRGRLAGPLTSSGPLSATLGGNRRVPARNGEEVSR